MASAKSDPKAAARSSGEASTRGSACVPTLGRTSWSRIQESMTKRVPIRRTEGRSGSIRTGRVVQQRLRMAKSVSSSVAVSGFVHAARDRGLHGGRQLEGRVVVREADQEGRRLEDLAPQRLQLGVAHERARGQQGQAQASGPADDVTASRILLPSSAEGVLAEDGHGHEVARQVLVARVVTARREQRVVDLRTQDGRLGGRGVRIDERLLGLGRRALSLPDAETELGCDDGHEVDDAGGVLLQRRAGQLGPLPAAFLPMPSTSSSSAGRSCVVSMSRRVLSKTRCHV